MVSDKPRTEERTSHFSPGQHSTRWPRFWCEQDERSQKCIFAVPDRQDFSVTVRDCQSIMLYKHILLKPAERATDLYQTQMSLKEPPANILYRCETHVPVSAWIMAGNSRNHSGFNFLCPWPSNHLKVSYLDVCFVVSCHSVSANSLKGAAVCFFLDSLFFVFF